ncbi:DNA-directed RNA polymerase specialized sigma subunit, sigma54 homolog [Solibacillus silvestris StLB046]|uniref:DNA-directed RNA polymerase specialized sigma subunit, sigma54 homolog n=1 Tax=Solibacillus silvestris (strain StLB046) TaxID=1002809 RepID=F2F965_SOLSS|nr:RNA polymerase factor sigma-54 [Solibacillus silvestris]BAK16160.1 DNA-directed RNA polymerase specialized sigma subunit, sigma54 homolog [Solibacillus silvestris StLB046]
MQMILNNSQKLTQVLSAKLLQHLEILQFSTNELEQYIYEKANENPLLSVIDAKVKGNYEEIMKLAKCSINTFSSHWNRSGKEQYNIIEKTLAEKVSYEQFLIEQIPMQNNLSEVDLKILNFLIQSLDDRLFLDTDLEFVCKKYNTSIVHVEAILNLLQTFEPVGVGARSYTEYLLIQIDHDPYAPKMAAEFINADLKLVATQAIKKLSKKYKMPLQEVQHTVNYIKNLNPMITGDKVEAIPYIIPDLTVKNVEGEWAIKLNRHYLPSVTIDETYVKLLKNDANNETYYRDSLKDALALMEGIEQRDKTLYDLARLLVQIQEDFFAKGMDTIKPMRLKDVSEVLDVHESTVSRAIRGKYIQTPHGIYALQSLFTKGLTNASGKMDSIMYIKKRIKELIEEEDKKKPLSDQQMTNVLSKEGIQISRRTVAKYREEMKIVSSANRTFG